VLLHKWKPTPTATALVLGLDETFSGLELELELIQTHMTQKPLLWVEVGAHAVRKRSECPGVWCGQVRVSRGACVCCL
jgi:hypothetical protein